MSSAHHSPGDGLAMETILADRRCRFIAEKMEITYVMEYEDIPRQKQPKMLYDYYASDAEDQWTLWENRNAFSRILKIDMSTTVLGFKISTPVLIAPPAMQKMAHPEGEYATARAASAARTIMVAATGPGICVNTDVFQALLAPGAAGIFIRRPVVFSQAADGEAA